ncbi:helix-turn-helix domain-containing protein [Maribacter algarum]|uniref:Helix-turn-helix domain-containing protein n=1 Tax=Maribacter algarum (ex Zhang et al. 2020) TaxID=2578118 RepID=A0A5S3PN04_9FLAO|nr:helix-turn-helix domain-containing protein [Maribacter algarum]TMM55848.1 helix-turn-helix domain-containing protein [Maribacter algarum]
MAANIITTEDLEEFRIKLLNEIKELLATHGRVGIDHWIKSGQVMNKLEISPGTLQNFRINGTIPFSKLGGIIYYDEEKINEILENNEIDFKRNAA